MTFTETSLKGSFLIALTTHGDSRGWFARTYCKKEFQEIGHTSEWVQMNHSFSAQKGTLRGLHFQKEPFAEIKMLRCIAGAVFDVIVDLRQGSPTYLSWYGAELSAANKQMLYVPKGFAHGFQTLSDNTELIYHHSEYYHPEAEAGVMYNDPALKINWPLEITEISDRDLRHSFIDINL